MFVYGDYSHTHCQLAFFLIVSNQHQPTILFMFFTTNSSDQLFCSYFSYSIQATNSFVYACTNQFHQPTLILPITSFFFNNHMSKQFNNQFSQPFSSSTSQPIQSTYFFAQPLCQPTTTTANQFVLTIQPSFLAFPAPPRNFFWQDFLFFTAKSWGEPCRGLVSSIPRFCIVYPQVPVNSVMCWIIGLYVMTNEDCHVHLTAKYISLSLGLFAFPSCSF